MTTHNEVFIEGTEPVPPQPQDVTDVAQGTQMPEGEPMAGDKSNSNGDDIVLVNEAPGHPVYVNTGAPIARLHSHALSSLDSTLPTNLTTQVETGAVPAAPRNADPADKGLLDHR